MKNQYRKLIVPEWERLYLDMGSLKCFLKVSKALQQKFREAQDDGTIGELQSKVVQSREIIQKLRDDNSQFIRIFAMEVQKLETFILFKYQDLKSKLGQLNEQCNVMQNISLFIDVNKQVDKRQFKKRSEILKESIYEFYNQSLQVQRYLYVNKMLLGQVIVKYQKYTFKEIRFVESIHTQLIFQDIETLNKIELKVKSTINSVSKLLISNFYPFQERHGLKTLKKYKEVKTTKFKTTFMFGLFAGVAVISTILLLLLRYQGLLDPKSDNVFSPLFPCFRGIGLFILYYWLLAIDQIMWVQHSINYKLFLGFNHHFSTVPDVLKRVSFFSALYMLMFLIYCFEVEGLAISLTFLHNYTQYFPLTLYILYLGYVLIPTKNVFNGKGKQWMFRMFYGALFYHWIQFEGRYTFVLDQFVSLWTPIRDLEYTICFYYMHLKYRNQNTYDYNICYNQQRVVSDICMITVFSLKCLHCISLAIKNKKFYKTNEMWNFLKNSLAVTVGALSFLTKHDQVKAAIWILCAASFTIIQYWWELNKDWLFFEKGSKIKFLRNDLGYLDPKIYYILGSLNLLVSSTWALTISPEMYSYFHIPNAELFILILGCMELMRRFIHNLFKVETVHIVNIRNFKACKEMQFPFESSQESNDKYRVTQFRLSGDQEAFRTSLAYDFKRLSMEQTNKNMVGRISYLPAEQYRQLDKLLSQPYDMMLIKEVNKQEYVNQKLLDENQKVIQEIQQL